MAIPHASPGQIVDVSPLGSRLLSEKTSALFKSHDLEVMRVVLQAGKSLPPHKVPGEVTIQCIEGELNIGTDGQNHLLRPGNLLYLSGNALHNVLALQDSSAIITVALKR